MKVSVFADAPFGCRNLSKKGIRSATVSIDGVGWENALVYCPRWQCGLVQKLSEGKVADSHEARLNAIVAAAKALREAKATKRAKKR